MNNFKRTRKKRRFCPVVELLEPRVVLSAGGLHFTAMSPSGAHPDAGFDSRGPHRHETSRPAIVRQPEGPAASSLRENAPGHTGASRPGRDQPARHSPRRGPSPDVRVAEVPLQVVPPVAIVPPAILPNAPPPSLAAPSSFGGGSSSLAEAEAPLLTLPLISSSSAVPASRESTTPSASDALRISLDVPLFSPATSTAVQGDSSRPTLPTTPVIGQPTSVSTDGGAALEVSVSRLLGGFEQGASSEVDQAGVDLTFVSLTIAQQTDDDQTSTTVWGATGTPDATSPSGKTRQSSELGWATPLLSAEAEGGLIKIDIDSGNDREQRSRVETATDSTAKIRRHADDDARDIAWRLFLARECGCSFADETEFEGTDQGNDEDAFDVAAGADQGGMIELTSDMLATAVASAETEVGEVTWEDSVEIQVEPAVAVFRAMEVAILAEVAADDPIEGDLVEGDLDESDEATPADIASDEPMASPALSPAESAEAAAPAEPLGARRQAASTSFLLVIMSFFASFRRGEKKEQIKCDIYAR